MLTKSLVYVYNAGQAFQPARAYSRVCPPPSTGPSTGTSSGNQGTNCYSVPIYGASGGSSGGPSEGGAGGSNVIGYQMYCNGVLVGTYYG